MKICKGCKIKFNPKKSFHSYCSDCFKLLCKCKTCGKTVFPKNNKYKCCNITESVEHVKEANKTTRIGLSLDELVFRITNKQNSTQAFIDNFGEDAYEDTLPNRD